MKNLAIVFVLLIAGASASEAQTFRYNCKLYGEWAVSVILEADAQGCDVNRTGDILNPDFHANWCRAQTPDTMSRARGVHITGVTHRCARQGKRVRIRG